MFCCVWVGPAGHYLECVEHRLRCRNLLDGEVRGADLALQAQLLDRALDLDVLGIEAQGFQRKPDLGHVVQLAATAYVACIEDVPSVEPAFAVAVLHEVREYQEVRQAQRQLHPQLLERALDLGLRGIEAQSFQRELCVGKVQSALTTDAAGIEDGLGVRLLRLNSVRAQPARLGPRSGSFTASWRNTSRML